ncbi:hypothetical protein TNCV_4448751 [Trichonephila clavipes]|nr:hypothetical protein TNCV_4448751 [Trichonephila clavipes]
MVSINAVPDYSLGGVGNRLWALCFLRTPQDYVLLAPKTSGRSLSCQERVCDVNIVLYPIYFYKWVVAPQTSSRPDVRLHTDYRTSW